MPLLHSYNLAKHMDGRLPPPSPMLENNQPNPQYETWFCHDQLVLSWIIGSITENLIPQIIGASHAKDAWDRLAKTFASGFKAPKQIVPYITTLIMASLLFASYTWMTFF